MTGFPDSTMIYLRNLSTDETFDSTLIIGNKFELKGELQDEPEQIWLNAKVDNKFIYTNLLIGNEIININGDIKDFPWNVNITGSKTQNDFNDLRDLTKSFNISKDSLIQDFENLTLEEKYENIQELRKNLKTIDDTTHILEIEYVKSHTNTYNGLIQLGYLKNSLPKDTIQALYNKLSDEIKTSKYARVIEIYLNEKISEVGDYFHDFKALDINEDTIHFSTLIGKHILLNFTAAYCGPCAQSAAELRFINNEYSDSLKIIGFSTDANKDFWLKHLERDSVKWISLWDGKGNYSDTYIKYGIQGVPTYFLIDPQGKIVDKWSGYGKGSLEKRLIGFKNK